MWSVSNDSEIVQAMVCIG